MTPADRELQRLRDCRQLFERAQADGVDMAEALRRQRADRWAELDRRLAAKRCGTVLSDRSEPPQQPMSWWQAEALR